MGEFNEIREFDLVDGLNDELIEIDGSEGEGGGQMIRTAFAMSAITGKPVNIRNIRANRPRSGLANQHLTAICAIANICEGRLEGAYKGSMEVSLHPGKIRACEMELDIGTAGSITLVLQAVLPVLSKARGESRIRIKGGTDVKWAPPADYLRNVLFPIYKNHGIDCRSDILKRGYYPRGGGEMHIRVRPAAAISWIPPNKEYGSAISGTINITGLPMIIAERMKKAAMDELRKYSEYNELDRSNGTCSINSGFDWCLL